MSRYVQHEGHLWPPGVFDPPMNPPKGACAHCGGTGQRVESIDDERPDVLVPCEACQEYCRVCDKYRQKGGHECRKP
jgi:excinuclease UvrABC ATPase subunit